MNLIKVGHRGNYKGIIPEYENTWDYAQKALSAGYHVELDVIKVGETFSYLGHDDVKDLVLHEDLTDPRIWIHCKTSDVYDFFKNLKNEQDYNYFCHTDGPFCITSKGYVWQHARLGPFIFKSFKEPILIGVYGDKFEY
jgi:hypothetical protein